MICSKRVNPLTWAASPYFYGVSNHFKGEIMQFNIICRTLTILALAAPCAALAAPLMHGRTGEWESTITSTMSGMEKMVSKQKMEHMTPQERQRMQALITRMNGTKTRKDHYCLTPADAKKGLIALNHIPGCTMKIVHQSRDAAETVQTCPNHGGSGKSVTRVQVRALSPTHFTTVADMHNSMGPKGHYTGDYRWLSATCPKDQ